jgi:hypothetical protein
MNFKKKFTFVGHFCPPGSGSGSTDPIESGSATLVEGANILHLLAASTAAPGVEAVLWPHLLEFLLQPEYTAAVAAISKALTVVAGRRAGAAEGEELAVAYQNLQVRDKVKKPENNRWYLVFSVPDS